MVVGDIDRAGRGLPEQACAKIEMVSSPFVLHHDEALAETRAHVAKSGFETFHGLLPRESVGDGDDNRPGHGEPLICSQLPLSCGAARPGLPVAPRGAEALKACRPCDRYGRDPGRARPRPSPSASTP